jgi:phosphoribulokinase
MSERHPTIAITGSSGAGTTSVTRTFENIFRREGASPCTVASFPRQNVPAQLRKPGQVADLGAVADHVLSSQ